MSYITDKNSIPLRLFNSSEDYLITVELKSGELYRGKLIHTSYNMDCQLSNVKYTNPNDELNPNKVIALDSVFIRGSNILLLILPDLLSEQNMFDKFQQDQDALIEKKLKIREKIKVQKEQAKQKRLQIQHQSLNLPAF